MALGSYLWKKRLYDTTSGGSPSKPKNRVRTSKMTSSEYMDYIDMAGGGVIG